MIKNIIELPEKKRKKVEIPWENMLHDKTISTQQNLGYNGWNR